MTNVNAPFGLRPVRRLDAAALSFQMERRFIAYNESSVIGTGDLVVLANTGYIDLYANGGTRVHGVFFGCKYFNPSVGMMKWYPSWTAPTLPSGTIVEAYIISDKNVVFEIQSGSAGTPFADIGTNSDVVVGTPNAYNGMSTTYLDATHDTTATFPLRVVGMGQGVSTVNQAGTTNGYDPLTGYNIVQVILNSFDMYNTTGL